MIQKKCVVIVAGPIEGQQLHDGFLKLSYESHLFIYSNPAQSGIRPRWLAQLQKLKNPQNFLYSAFNRTLRTRVIPLVEKIRPGFILVYKGHYLENDNREWLERLGCPIAFWANDSMSRIHSQNHAAELATYRFYIDGGDVKDEHDVWLPVGYDPEVCRFDNVTIKYDIGYVGRMLDDRYIRRREYLLRLSNSSLPNKYLCVAACGEGTKKDQAKLDAQLTFPNKGWLPYDEYRKFVAETGICINIHQNDGIMPINPMFFNIPGLNVCQIAEDRDYFAEWLEPWKEYVPFNETNYLELVSMIAENRELKERIAKAGLKRVEDSHTFYHRAMTIAEYMEKV